MHELVGASSGSKRFDKIGFVLLAISDEISEEMNDYLTEHGEENMETYWAWVSHILAWIGHGDVEQLPEPLKPFARRIVGIPEPQGPLELESGEVAHI